VAIFPQLFESVPDALVIVDRDGRIRRANGNAERLFGFESGAMLGLPIEELVPAEARTRHRAHRDDYMNQPRVRPMGSGGMTLVGQRRDGRQFPVEIALSPIETEEGLHYLASVRDISETLLARQALSRARYDAVVARIGQVALADTGESVLELLSGWLAGAIQFPTVGICLMHGEDARVRHAVGPEGHLALDGAWTAAKEGPFQRALASGQPSVKDDPEGWPPGTASGVIQPLMDRDQAIGALVALSDQPRVVDRDVLQMLQTVGSIVSSHMLRRRTEEQLAHAQRLDAIGQLTGGIAHDFNNLLTVVMGSLQLLDFEYDAQPGAREVIASALRSVERGAELTSKLLAFARRQHLSPRAVHPASLLGDLELLLRGTLGDNIRLQVDCAPDLPSTYADPSQLDSALVNLALNARDALPDGGHIVIDASERWIDPANAQPDLRPGHYIVFSVADDGHGMSADVLEHACEPFFTTKAIGRGSGLGLSMVYGFIKQSGGHLGIESAPGCGTRIELLLPVAPKVDGEGRKASEGPVGGFGTVLVVEDEASVLEIATSFLRSLGYEVIAVDSAVAALERLAGNEPISLIFSDVMLGGGMNGIELAEAARTLRPQLGVLLTSGYAADSSIDFSHPFELLRKPYRREALAQAIRRNLAHED
jgi:PAS domain S-box-containing protein